MHAAPTSSRAGSIGVQKQYRSLATVDDCRPGKLVIRLEGQEWRGGRDRVRRVTLSLDESTSQLMHIRKDIFPLLFTVSAHIAEQECR